MGKKDIPLSDTELVRARADFEAWRARACVNTVVESWVSECEPPAESTVDCHVTLLQMAAICNRSKRTLRRLHDDGTLPAPVVQGSKGQPSEWRWSDVRPVLEKRFGKTLPAVFPASQFVR